MTAGNVTDAHPREEALDRLDGGYELLMVVLGLVWLALVAVELVTTLPPWLGHVTTAVWGVFVADFVVRLVIAHDRGGYLRANWLTIVALVVPALRVFRVARFVRVLRATRAVRGVRAVRIVTTFGRARRSVHALLARRHALGYVVALTLVVAFLGAAGMYAFERDTNPFFDGYVHAVWWTLMLLMTMGTDGWPLTGEGRALSLVLALYGFVVFGYITASLASWFVGQDKRAAAQPTFPT